MSCRCLIAFAAALLAGAAPSRAAERAFVDAELGFVRDDNVSRAERARDTFEDYIAKGAAALSYRAPAGARGQVVVRGGIEAEIFADWDDLSHAGPTGALEYRFQPRAGYTAPWYALALAGSYRWYRDSAIREGPEIRVTASAGRRLTDRFAGRLGYGYERRRAVEGDVFDTDLHRLFAEFDWDLTAQWLLYGALEWRDGEVVSTASASPSIRAVAEAFEPDFAFTTSAARAALEGAMPAPGVSPPGLRVAYRLDARTGIARLGANYALNDAAALDVTALYHDTRGRGDNDYHGLIVSAGVLLRF
jgi:hypothetical protein